MQSEMTWRDIFSLWSTLVGLPKEGYKEWVFQERNSRSEPFRQIEDIDLNPRQRYVEGGLFVRASYAGVYSIQKSFPTLFNKTSATPVATASAEGVHSIVRSFSMFFSKLLLTTAECNTARDSTFSLAEFQLMISDYALERPLDLIRLALTSRRWAAYEHT